MKQRSYYTWRNEWISNFESPFSTFEKFKMANSMSKKDLLNLVKSSEQILSHIKPIYNGLGKWNLLTMEAYHNRNIELLFGIPIQDNNQQILKDIAGAIQKKNLDWIHLFHFNLRFCVKCLSQGFHSVYHQYKFLEHCPLHSSKLLSTCPKCKRCIKYEMLERRAFQCDCGFCFLVVDTTKTFFVNWGKFDICISNNSYRNKDIMYFDERRLLDPIIMLKAVSGSLDSNDRNSKWIMINKTRTKKIIIDSPESYEEIYHQCISTYKAISRYIRKHICKEHRLCIKRYVRNHPDNDHCSVALAYIYWRNHIEGLSDVTNVDNHQQKKKILYSDQLLFPICLEVSTLEKIYKYCEMTWKEIDEEHMVVNILLNNTFALILINLFQYYNDLFTEHFQSNKSIAFSPWNTSEYIKPSLFYSIIISHRKINIQLTSNIENRISNTDKIVICRNRQIRGRKVHNS